MTLNKSGLVLLVIQKKNRNCLLNDHIKFFTVFLPLFYWGIHISDLYSGCGEGEWKLSQYKASVSINQDLTNNEPFLKYDIIDSVREITCFLSKMMP